MARLATALDQFLERPPEDLPDGLLDKLKDLRTEVGEHNPQGISPGHQAALDKMAAIANSVKKDEPELSPGKQAANEAHDRAGAERGA